MSRSYNSLLSSLKQLRGGSALVAFEASNFNANDERALLVWLQPIASFHATMLMGLVGASKDFV